MYDVGSFKASPIFRAIALKKRGFVGVQSPFDDKERFTVAGQSSLKTESICDIHLISEYFMAEPAY